MVFVTATFAVFVAVVLCAHLTVHRSRRWWCATMLAASCVFYGWFDIRLVGVLAVVATITHVGARLVERGGRWRTLCGPTVIAVLVSIWATLRHGASVATWATANTWDIQPGGGILVPVGVSFMTFQAISYIVDVRRGHTDAATSWTRTALYLSFFPQLAAGPLIRAKGFFRQLERGPHTNIDITRAGVLITLGVFKKLVVADHLFTPTTRVYANPDAYGAVDALGALFGGLVRAYCDVSSYADIAVGLGILLGIDLPANFKRPFAATSIADLWTRWHLTVYAWLRDYLFRPLARGATGTRLFVAAVVTMTFSGLWHGFGPGFFLWGALHGTLLGIEAVWRAHRIRQRRRPVSRPVTSWLGRMWVLTFMAVTGGLAVGYTPDQVAAVVGRLAVPSAPIETTVVVAVMIVGAVLCHWTPERWSERLNDGARRLPLAVQAAAAAVLLTVIAGAGVGGVSPYLYFNL